MKHVLYEDIQGWALTPEPNYKNMIEDVNKVTHFSKKLFPDRNSVIEYITNILKLRPDMVIDKTKRFF